MANAISIPLSEVMETSNYRKSFNDEAISELAKSIDRDGLLQPILVKELSDGKYQLIAGERRYRAHKLLGKENVDAILLEDVNDEDVLNIQLVENSQRVNPTPVEEYAAFEEKIRKGHSPDKIADDICKSLSYVNERLKIKYLSDESKVYLQDGIITLSHAKQLAKLQHDDQDKALRHIIKTNGDVSYSLNSTDLKRFIERNIEVNLSNAKFDIRSKSFSCGSCTSCVKRSGANKELFEDIQNDDICFDPKCFIGKTKEHLDYIENELIQADVHDSVIKVSTEVFTGDKDGVLSLSELKLSESYTGCLGVIQDGELTGKIVNVQTEDDIDEDTSSEDENEPEFHSSQVIAIDLFSKRKSIDSKEFDRLILYQLYRTMDKISQRKVAEVFNWKLFTSGVEQKFDYTNTLEFFEENTKKLLPEQLKVLTQVVSLFLYFNDTDYRLESAFDSFSSEYLSQLESND